MNHRLRRAPRESPARAVFTTIVGRIRREVRYALATEIPIVKAEIARKLNEMKSGLAGTGVGAGLLHAAAIVLVISLGFGVAALFALWLPVVTSLWLGTLAAALAAGIAGYVWLRGGLKKLSPKQLVPKKSVEAIFSKPRRSRR